jgi:hypothetical protein
MSLFLSSRWLRILGIHGPARPREVVRSPDWSCNAFAGVQDTVHHGIDQGRPLAASSQQLFDPDPVVATVPVSGTTGCIWPSGAGLVGGATVLGMFSVLRRPPPVLFVSTLSAQGTPQIFERGQIMILKTQKGGVPPLVLAAASDR